MYPPACTLLLERLRKQAFHFILKEAISWKLKFARVSRQDVDFDFDFAPEALCKLDRAYEIFAARKLRWKSESS